MKYYYLKDNRIWMATSEMPNKNWNYLDYRRTYNRVLKDWQLSLQPCEISESELDKINKFIRAEYNDDYPIDVTNIIYVSYDSKNDIDIIEFKEKPKQVDIEIEAVEFDKWKLQLLKEYRLKFDEHDIKWLYWERGKGFGKSVDSEQLYEIFKNRK